MAHTRLINIVQRGEAITPSCNPVGPGSHASNMTSRTKEKHRAPQCSYRMCDSAETMLLSGPNKGDHLGRQQRPGLHLLSAHALGANAAVTLPKSMQSNFWASCQDTLKVHNFMFPSQRPPPLSQWKLNNQTVSPYPCLGQMPCACKSMWQRPSSCTAARGPQAQAAPSNTHGAQAMSALCLPCEFMLRATPRLRVVAPHCVSYVRTALALHPVPCSGTLFSMFCQRTHCVPALQWYCA